MGQIEVKKFIALLALVNLGDNKPVELITWSTYAGYRWKIAIGENIKAVLCGRVNELRQFLALIRTFESGYWKSIDTISDLLSLDLKMTQAFYNESLKWGVAMRQSVRG